MTTKTLSKMLCFLVLLPASVSAHGGTRTKKDLLRAREREATELLKQKEKGSGKIFDGRTAHHFLRSLAGTWTGTANGSPATVEYRVSAGDSIVVETLFPGSEHEMVTIYWLDEGDLHLTHYCTEKNQPEMAFRRSDRPHTLSFEFTRSGNHMHDGDSHMHALTHHLEPGSGIDPSDDVLTSTWTQWEHEKESGQTVLELRRVK